MSSAAPVHKVCTWGSSKEVVVDGMLACPTPTSPRCAALRLEWRLAKVAVRTLTASFTPPTLVRSTGARPAPRSHDSMTASNEPALTGLSSSPHAATDAAGFQIDFVRHEDARDGATLADLPNFGEPLAAGLE